ncbi:hypothetical protein [Desulfitobacterium chlororespirans]|uniref:hypothetical protein n=1 Tax=Desulfitobacterium chlororespirans TaxID=51616 RepID=UPI001FA81D46|nr:hypothetical protein [Desulfitobacterium chlororespirans]
MDTVESQPKAKEKINANLVVGVLLIGSFVALLNQTLLVTALPHIMADLHVDTNKAQWLTTAFLLVNGIMIPTTAFLRKDSQPAVFIWLRCCCLPSGPFWQRWLPILPFCSPDGLSSPQAPGL